MDNFTRLTTADLETLGRTLCELMVENFDYDEHPYASCQDFCPFRKQCWYHHNGFVEWLKEDAKCEKSMKQSD